ncbi:MAG: hypothetical protein ACP5N2_01015 [Candidatus Nanoarchaeia archaeon]
MPKNAPRTRFGQDEDRLILQVQLDSSIPDHQKISKAAELIKTKLHLDRPNGSIYQRLQRIPTIYNTETLDQAHKILNRGNEKLSVSIPSTIVQNEIFPIGQLNVYDREIEKVRSQIEKMYYQREKVVAKYFTSQAESINSYSQFIQYGKMTGLEIAALDVDNQKEFINFIKNKDGYVTKLENIDILIVNAQGPGKIIFPFYNADIERTNTKSAQSVVFNGVVYLFSKLFKEKLKPSVFHDFAATDFKTSLNSENIQDLGTKLNEITTGYPFLNNTRINFLPDNSNNYSFLQGGQ